MTISTSDIQALYIAYFNRPADYLGLTFWTNAATQAGSVAVVANAFSASPEYTTLYAGKSSAEIIDSIYVNLFGRHAEPAGISFWGNALESGQLNIGNIAYQIFKGAQNADLVAVQSKVSAATAFYNALDTNAAIVGYNGAAADAVVKTWLSGVVDTTTLNAATTAAALNTVTTAAAAAHSGESTTNAALTTGVDTLVGGAGDDNFNGVIDSTLNATDATLTALDSIDGKAGNNSLSISDLDAAGSSLPAGVTLTNIQTINLKAAGIVNSLNFSGFSGVTSVNVTQSTGADILTVGSTQAVSVNDTAGLVTVHGGASQNVTTAGGVVLDKSVGAITVADSAQGIANSTIDGGTSVTMSTTNALATANNTAGTIATITIGGAAKPTGAIALTENETGDTTGATFTGNVAITGGSSVSVTSNATQAALATTGANFTLTQGTVGVTGSAVTTSVTVNQAAAAAEVDTVAAVTGIKEVDSAKFVALTAGQTLIVDGLTFTAGAAGTTVAQTAAAFANLAKGATQGNSALGTYSGVMADYSTGAVSGANSDTVSFTYKTAATAVNTPVFTGTGTGPAVSNVTAGLTAVTATAGVGGIVDGIVTIADAHYGAGTNSIASVTLSSYGNTSSISSDALTTLSLASTLDVGLTVNDHTATTLGLTLNNVEATAPGALSTLDLDGVAATYTTLNVHTATADSAVAITAAAVQTLTVDGTNAVDLTGSVFTALKTVTLSGAASVTTDATAFAGANVTDVNAAASSGTNTITIDASKATYEGGSGTDMLTLASTTVSKAINLGAGNDTIVLAVGTGTPGATIDGGAGTNTLSMDAGDAVTASGSAAFAAKVIDFQHLTLTGATTDEVDLVALGNYSYVTAHGATLLTLDNMASGGTLVIDGANTADVVNVTNATTGTADVANVVVTGSAIVAAGSLTIAHVETVNLSALDTNAKDAAGTITHTVTLVDTAATAITVTGNANLNLTNTGNTAVSTIDASGMTGGLTVTTAGTVAETVKGGAGSNHLTAHVGSVADTLIGGAGNDTLTANAGLDTLTGGAGHNTFVVSTPSLNSSSYATITDAKVGDVITMGVKGVDVFSQAKISLAATAVFQDYANAAIAAGGDSSVNGHISWFQYGGDTYIVESTHNATLANAGSFSNGTDLIVKLTGAVDLSHTSLSTTNATLLIG